MVGHAVRNHGASPVGVLHPQLGGAVLPSEACLRRRLGIGQSAPRLPLKPEADSSENRHRIVPVALALNRGLAVAICVGIDPRSSAVRLRRVDDCWNLAHAESVVPIRDDVQPSRCEGRRGRSAEPASSLRRSKSSVTRFRSVVERVVAGDAGGLGTLGFLGMGGRTTRPTSVRPAAVVGRLTSTAEVVADRRGSGGRPGGLSPRCAGRLGGPGRSQRRPGSVLLAFSAARSTSACSRASAYFCSMSVPTSLQARYGAWRSCSRVQAS